MRHYRLMTNKYMYYSVQWKDDIYICKWQVKCANNWRFLREKSEKGSNSIPPVLRFKNKDLAKKHVEKLQEEARMYNTDWVVAEVIN